MHPSEDLGATTIALEFCLAEQLQIVNLRKMERKSFSFTSIEQQLHSKLRLMGVIDFQQFMLDRLQARVQDEHIQKQLQVALATHHGSIAINNSKKTAETNNISRLEKISLRQSLKKAQRLADQAQQAYLRARYEYAYNLAEKSLFIDANVSSEVYFIALRSALKLNRMETVDACANRISQKLGSDYFSEYEYSETHGLL